MRPEFLEPSEIGGPFGGDVRRDVCEHIIAVAKSCAAAGRDGQPDPLHTLRQFEEVGVEPWVGAVVGLLESVDQLKRCARRGVGPGGAEQVRQLFLGTAEQAVAGLALLAEQQSRDLPEPPASPETGPRQWNPLLPRAVQLDELQPVAPGRTD